MSANDISLTYRQRFLNNQLSFNRKYKAIFDKIANDFSLLANDPNMRFSKAFKFNGVINKKIDIIIESFNNQVLALTEQEIEKSWGFSNSKNDEIISDYLKTITIIKTAQKAKYFLPNLPALKAFISSDRGAGTLADSIWKVGAQFRSELETHLGLGILNGDSASVISRRIRIYLQNPDALFRRVRDNNGRLVASKAMIENAPGAGVYNSAYKNALRTARTNTNQSFLLADHVRWLKLPMVIGVKISLSAQHKIYDICDECEGTYPKDFIWVGWHPQCLCHAVAVLMPQSDFKDYLKGNKPLEAKQIETYSDKFQNYVKNNFERYSNYKSTPFWIEDNIQVIKDILRK